MAVHPYFPLDAAIPHFRPNETDLPLVLASFGGSITAALVIVWAISRRKWTESAPTLGTADSLAVLWFALCGFLHCFFEGYFILNHESLASLQTVFAQAWKEYALSDSRYLTSDPFMLCVESITVVVWGPLCWSIVLAILARSPLRHPLQIVMCIGHLYGVALYYSTSLTEWAMVGTMHSRPEFLYFWIYYVGFNGPWVVVPLVLLTQSFKRARLAFAALEKEEESQRLASIVGANKRRA